jgi:small subunit ribosomal protein S4
VKYTGPKVKLSRRLGIPLTPKAAKVMEKRPNPPGQHGDKKFRRKTSDYARQLTEKQKLRAQFNIHERQLRNYLARAQRTEGVTGDNLIRILESRLDAFVLRAGFAKTIYAARQYVRHGHLLVDGKRVDLPGYELKPGQVVSVKPNSQKLEFFKDALDSAYPPEYIALDKSNMSATLKHLPERAQSPVQGDLQLVIEFYSR